MSGDLESLQEYRAILGIACALAECLRHDLPTKYFQNFQYFQSLYPPGEESAILMEQMFFLYNSMPPLTFDTDDDLNILESAVQQAAGLVGFCRFPRIIQEKGKNVWLLERL